MRTWFWRALGVPANSAASRQKLGIVALLYFIQGAPAAILWEVLPVYFRINGVSLRAIGGLRLLELPYSLKVLWSPLVHRFGDRRFWVTACMLGIAAVLFALPFVDIAAVGLIVLVLLLAIGVRIQTGFFGVLAIFAILILFAMAWSCVSMIFALRTQNARLVQSLFILVFPFLYLTTSQAPMDLLPPAFRFVATYNPVTYVIEGVRALVLYSWDAPAIWQGFLVSGALCVALVLVALSSFQKTIR